MNRQRREFASVIKEVVFELNVKDRYPLQCRFAWMSGKPRGKGTSQGATHIQSDTLVDPSVA